MFDSLLQEAEKIYDSGNRRGALAFISMAHATAQGLTVMDEMNYYTYCSGNYLKDFRDYDIYLTYADSILALLEARDKHHLFPDRLVQAYNMKADAFFAKDMYTESYDFYFKAQKHARENADSCSLSKYSYSLGMALYRQQRYLESAEHFKESYQLAATCKDQFMFFYHKQELLDNIGLCYFNAGKDDSAMIYYRKAIALIDANYMRFQKEEKVYASPKAVVCGNMADIYMARGVFDTAKQLLEYSIKTNLQKGGTNNDAVTAQLKLAKIHYKQNDLNSMYQLLEAIHAELDTIPDAKSERNWYKLMWQYHDRKQDAAAAYPYLVRYMALNDSFVARNKVVMAVDIDGKVKALEKQNQIMLLNKKGQRNAMLVWGLLVLMAFSLIVIIISVRNAAKNRRTMAELTALNNKVNDQKAKLEVLLAELEAKDKDKSRILRSVAHDIMNPITAIMALADILIEESADGNEEHMAIFNMIKEACGNSLNLSKDILEAAVKLDEQTMAKEEVSMNKLIASSVDLLSLNAAPKQQKIRLESKQAGIVAKVNRDKIWRLLNNLISNAIKFSYNKSEIVVFLEASGGKVHIAVQDKGVGIPDKNKSYVFDMFTEAISQGTAGETPHGLGLSICQQIVKAHGGTIWFESELGKGTTFHVELPQ